mmetsp:Transcript_21394/g.43193  ORF Transcript_21394/g.43193 Transcript_21394/m.43193 type:complete len:402 (-) Transcript_21394:130-1335(-)
MKRRFSSGDPAAGKNARRLSSGSCQGGAGGAAPEGSFVKKARTESAERKQVPPRLRVRLAVDMLKKQGRSVSVSRPKEVACMSRSKDMSWRYGDKSGYSEFRVSQAHFPMDLSQGFEEFARTWEPKYADNLSHVLAALKHAPPLSRKPNVVAWRGILTKIMTTPFLPRDGFQFTVWKWNGVLYLGNRDSESKMEEERRLAEGRKRMMYTGYKFEEICTRSADKPVEAREVDPRECFCRIFKSSIGRFSLIGAGEMDCYDPEKKVDMELKVTAEQHTDRQKHNFRRFKLIKYYCQSFLSGVPYIIVGFRDRDFQVHRIETLETLMIPRLIRGQEDKYWDAKMCLQFLEYVLEWLDALVPESRSADPNQDPCYLIQYMGKGEFLSAPSARTFQENIDPSLYIA